MPPNRIHSYVYVACNFPRVSTKYDSREHDWENWPPLQFKTIFDFITTVHDIWQNMEIW